MKNDQEYCIFCSKERRESRGNHQSNDGSKDGSNDNDDGNTGPVTVIIGSGNVTNVTNVYETNIYDGGREGTNENENKSSGTKRGIAPFSTSDRRMGKAEPNR